MTSAVWFRRDLRVDDNRAVREALGSSDVLPIFVVDPRILSASNSPNRALYLRSCLHALDSECGGTLNVGAGRTENVLVEFCRDNSISKIFTSSDGSAMSRSILASVRSELALIGVDVRVSDTPYVVAPGRLQKADGSSYRVFSPFMRAWTPLAVQQAKDISSPMVSGYGFIASKGGRIWNLGLLGEDDGAQDLPAASRPEIYDMVSKFVTDDLESYGVDRDYPALQRTSRLSVALRFGRVHPRTLIRATREKDTSRRYLAELCWREFYADVLALNPNSPRESFNVRFDSMRWSDDSYAYEQFDAWRNGKTGYPIVDAGMRQLASEGYMHNRVRMIVASFLVKDLHIDWRWGARHFMDLLFDGDVASNTGGWQWVAGCGTDSAPFFRIFNPTLQGKKFDPEGDYVKRYVPELRSVQTRFIHEPWLLGASGLDQLGYVAPIVDHAIEREEALVRFAELGRLADS